MLRNWKLATLVAIAISAGGTWSSVQAGGNGHSGGSHLGHSHSGSSGGFSGGMSGGFKPSGGFQSGGFNPSGGSNNGSSGNSGVVRSGNLGGVNLGNLGGSSGGVKSAPKTLPKNTGVVGPVVPRVGPSNTGIAGGIKLPGVGTIGGSNSGNSNSGVVKKGNNNSNPILKSPVLGGLGINLGNKFPNNGPGQGNGNGPGNGNGNGPGNGNGNGPGNGNHHHHCWPPIVISLPVCQPNYCPPPCPPIYYPQPYPVAVPIADPVPIVVTQPAPAVVVNNNVVVDDQPVDPTTGKPVDASKPAEQVTSTNVADTKPTASRTETVGKDETLTATPLPQIPVGATLTLQGKDLADKQGQVVVQLGEIALPATINEWKNDSVTCTLPVLGLTKASKATLHVVKADGKTASTMNCELVTTLPTSVDAAPASATDADSARFEQ